LHDGDNYGFFFSEEFGISLKKLGLNAKFGQKYISHSEVTEEVYEEVALPFQKVISNARKEVGIRSCLSESFLEVDAWFPDLKLGFEYQNAEKEDKRHYSTTCIKIIHC